MSIANRDVFYQDPSSDDIPNLGVVKVGNPDDEGDWITLAWELKNFVCEGQYAAGLERMLSQYLTHLDQAEQPATWVSGFYGSGKSHLMRVLEFLWLNPTLPNGETARSLTTLTSDIDAHLVELSNAGKRAGGVWSAAGTLGAGAAGSVRLAFLNIIFESANLPQQFGPARLAIWLRQQEMYDGVVKHITEAGKSFDNELRNLYVSPILAEALIKAGATFGETPAAVSSALQQQFKSPTDISDEQMLDTFQDVMRLQTTTEGKLPLTLVVLDEMQQYINDDSEKALRVQNLVEACSSRFDSRVLVVATGQSDLAANPTLQKLNDRFRVQIALSDTDVETVVRQVVLRKKPEYASEVEDALEAASGEIDRQLGGTRIEAKAADKTDWIADYPLLPTRRRFWETALRSIDKAGKAGVLRTQLKIVHDAAASVAHEPLGHVIGGDFIFQSESASMLRNGVLLREIDDLIRGLDDGTADGILASRACSLVFLISLLPQDGPSDIGVKATAHIIADLLVEDLRDDGALLRKDVPRLLDQLATDGKLLKIGDEYRVQTEEGGEWTIAFRRRQSTIRDDATRMSSLRNEWLGRKIDEELRGLRILHGKSKVPRRTSQHWNQDEPTPGGSTVPIWIRDEWQVTESAVRNAAAQRGDEDPTIHVLLPKIDPDAIRDALAGYAAASETISQRPEPQTDEGKQAKRSMQSTMADEEERLNRLFDSVMADARVLQSGGNELTTTSLRDGVEEAAQSSLIRLFPRFDVSDHTGWGKVLTRARDGAPDALAEVDFSKGAPEHPVCKEILSSISFTGTSGSAVQRDRDGSPFGWSDDAVNGAVMALYAHGSIRAEQDGKKLGGPAELPKTQIGRCTFFKEDEPPTMSERLSVRGLISAAEIHYEPGQEGASISGALQKLLDLAKQAGGPEPLPPQPDTSYIVDLTNEAGNQQFRSVAQKCELLHSDLKLWSAGAADRESRMVEWQELKRLLTHAEGLDAASDARAQQAAIYDERRLLEDPNPVAPLIKDVSAQLRTELQAEMDAYESERTEALASLGESDEWQQLSETDREELLGGESLGALGEVNITTDALVLVELDRRPLSGWKTQRQAIQPKIAAVRQAAAKKLEPKSISLSPPKGTLKTETDVDSYLAELKAAAMKHIDAGETVII